MKTITARFRDKAEAVKFLRDSVRSHCYPWSIDGLRLSIARKPEQNQGWLVETWHYTEDAADLIEPWITFMVLCDYDIQVQATNKRSIRRI